MMTDRHESTVTFQERSASHSAAARECVEKGHFKTAIWYQLHAAYFSELELMNLLYYLER